MPSTKSTAVYRKMLRQAIDLTWQRKPLWIFGIFAALVSTGGVIDVALRGVQRVEESGGFLERLLDTSFIGYEVAVSHMQQIQLLGPGRTAGILIATVILGLLITVSALLSQGALVKGVSTKTMKDPYTLRRAAWAHVWDLAAIGIINKLLSAVLVLVMTLPLVLFYAQTSVANAWLFFCLMLVFLPIMVIVQIVYMLSLMHIIEKNEGLIEAVHHGIRLFKQQWVATIEYGLALFFLVFGAGLIFVALLALLSVPYAILFTTSLLSGSFAFFIASNLLFALVTVALIMAFGGAVVTFQYTAWHLFFKRALHKTHGKKHFSKLMRLFH